MRSRLWFPHVGYLDLSYDQIVFVSHVWDGRLWKVLPIKALRASTHFFDIKPIPDFNASWIIITGTRETAQAALQLLQANEHHLGGYRATKVEVAIDAL